MDAATLTAIAAIIGASTGLLAAVGTILTLVIGWTNRAAISRVSAQVDGQMSTLARMASTVDPAIAAEATAAKVLAAAEAAAKVLETAQRLMETASERVAADKRKEAK